MSPMREARSFINKYHSFKAFLSEFENLIEKMLNNPTIYTLSLKSITTKASRSPRSKKRLKIAEPPGTSHKACWH
jgi:hypothetical protein